MTTKNISILLGVCVAIGVISLIIMILPSLLTKGEGYHLRDNKINCSGGGCKSPWAKSKDFGNGNCHTFEGFLDMEFDERNPLRFARQRRKKLVRYKDSRRGTDYKRSKQRMLNRHSRNLLDRKRNKFSSVKAPVKPPVKAPAKPPVKAPAKPPVKAPAKPPEKPVKEKFTSFGRRYCYKTGKGVFAEHSY